MISQTICRRSQRRRRGIFVALPFQDGFKLRRSEIEYAAPTELGLYGWGRSTKMTHLRCSTARRAQIGGKK
jgi:hypothetical protein